VQSHLKSGREYEWLKCAARRAPSLGDAVELTVPSIPPPDNSADRTRVIIQNHNGTLEIFRPRGRLFLAGSSPLAPSAVKRIEGSEGLPCFKLGTLFDRLELLLQRRLGTALKI
jgi:hypothetical protein